MAFLALLKSILQKNRETVFEPFKMKSYEYFFLISWFFQKKKSREKNMILEEQNHKLFLSKESSKVIHLS